MKGGLPEIGSPPCHIIIYHPLCLRLTSGRTSSYLKAFHWMPWMRILEITIIRNTILKTLLYPVQWDILHPLLLLVWRHGEADGSQVGMGVKEGAK